MLQENNAQSTKHTRYRSIGQMLFLMIIYFVIWTPVAIKADKEFSIRPTMLLLKAEACHFLRRNGLSPDNTNVAGDSGSCSLMVPVIINQFDGDVVIYQDNQHFLIAKNQLLAVALPDKQPWTSSQALWAGLLAIASILLGCAMIGIIVLLNSKKAGSKP